jgi:hypothetical protein
MGRYGVCVPLLETTTERRTTLANEGGTIMSQNQFGETTRRAFLGTATVATAASLTAPTRLKPSARLNWRKLMRMLPHS